MENVTNQISNIDPAEQQRAANDPLPVTAEITADHPGAPLDDSREQRLLPHHLPDAIDASRDGKLTREELMELVTRLNNLVSTYQRTNETLSHEKHEIETALHKTQAVVDQTLEHLAKTRHELQAAHRWPPSRCAELTEDQRIVRAEQQDHDRRATMPRPPRTLLG